MTEATPELVVYEAELGWRYRYGGRDDGNYFDRETAEYYGRCWARRVEASK